MLERLRRARAWMYRYLPPKRLERLRLGNAFLIGLSMPVSVTFSEIFSLLALLVLLAERRTAANLRLWRDNPVFWAGCGLFAVLALGTTYSIVPASESLFALFKYRELLYLPFFMLLCRDERGRAAGLYGFYGGVVLILAVGTSTLYRPLANEIGAVIGRVPYDSAFGSYITEGMLVAVGVYFFTVEAIRRPGLRWIAIPLILWSLLYALLLNTGRTGFVVLVIVAFALMFQLTPRRLWLRSTAAILLVAAAAIFVSPRMHTRMMGTGQALQVAGNLGQPAPGAGVEDQGGRGFHDPGVNSRGRGSRHLYGKGDPPDMAAHDPRFAASSASARLEFLRVGAKAFLRHPIWGTGTGSFAAAYAAVAAEQDLFATGNPHNEYLMIAVQTGLVGLAALLAFFWVLWRTAGRLPLWDGRQAQALTIAFALACLFNSLLLDHKDGHTFAFLVSVLFGGAWRGEDQRRHNDL
jgi:O-antigen ligase